MLQPEWLLTAKIRTVWLESRHNERCRADHRPHISGSSFLHLLSFYAEENHVYRSNQRGIVGGFGSLDDDLASAPELLSSADRAR